METKQSYISKTISCGHVTVIIRRPDIDDAERAKRAKRIVDTLEHSLRDYLKRGTE